jgi:ribonuclease-3
VNSQDLEKALNYKFNNRQLLETALCHSSYSNESRNGNEPSNERLEFLGDSIFNGIISDLLYHRLDQCEEGELTKKRAAIVKESSLAECAMRLGLGRYLKLGKGEENTGGRLRRSILADAMEAVIAAIYLDGGISAAKAFVTSIFSEIVEEAISGDLYKDYKTAFQEKLQANGDVSITYILENEEGPDHEKTFHVSLIAGGGVMGKGTGKTKKMAEQDAAKDALKALSSGE